MYGKAPGFRRSSENTNAGDLQARTEEDRHRKLDEERGEDLEALSYLGSRNSGVVRRATLAEVCGDPKLYDLEGKVGP